MYGFRSFLLLGTAACLLGQTPPGQVNQLPPGAGVELSVENPGVPPPHVPADRVVITVGAVKITAGQFDRLVESLAPQYRQAAMGTGRKQFGDNIAQMLTLAQEAQRRKLDDTEDFRTRALFQNANALASTLVDDIQKTVKVTDADLHQYFDAHKSEFEQVHARHILIGFAGSGVPVRPGQKELTEAESLAKAQDLRKKILGGMDFAELAKVESDDTGSGAAGGDLGSFRHGQMVPSFEESAFTLKPGELSEPVKSQFGYHLIRVESHDTRSFDDVRADIESRVQPQQSQAAVTKAIADLQKASPAVFDPEYFSLDQKSPDQKTPEQKTPEQKK